MNGKTFMRTLARKGIPCSVFAAKTNSNINDIYELKHKNEIPKKYLAAARIMGIINLPA